MELAEIEIGKNQNQFQAFVIDWWWNLRYILFGSFVVGRWRSRAKV